MEKSPKILAVAGKGGVGKTSISAAIVKLLVAERPEARILAIDADPAVGLSTALGVEVKTSIDDIRRAVIESVENGEDKEAIELLGEARYRIFDAMTEQDGFAFIAIGRPEASGCYCRINSYLKAVIGMLSGEFDYVVIDGEAGIEQINRRVMEKVSHLLLITDPSKKGTQVIGSIKKVADELVMYERLGAIVNRMPDASLRDFIETGDIPVLACIEDDRNLAALDIRGESVLALPDDSNLVSGVREALQKLDII